MNSVMPAARASSMAYWISGRSTSVMISLGIDLVAGRNLVPRPATGKIAFVTLLIIQRPFVVRQKNRGWSLTASGPRGLQCNWSMNT
jgi:hypothetical protein